MNSIHELLFLQYPRKARGQVTVAATVTAIMTSARFLRFRVTYLLVGGFVLTTFPVMATFAATMAFLRFIRFCFFVGFANGPMDSISMSFRPF